MGGSTASQVNPASYISPPGVQNEVALSQAQGNLGAGQIGQSGQLLTDAAGIPQQGFSPYVWGAQGEENQAKTASAVNIANSQALEKQFSPDAAAMRDALPKDLNADLSGNYFKTMTPQLMSQLFGSGLDPNSVIGKSGLFDATTAAGLAQRQKAEQAAGSYLSQNQAPVTGIDPGSIAQQQQGAKQANTSSRNAFTQNILQGAGQQNQGVTDWINGVMGNTSSVNNANNANWQNYQQAFLNSATNNASSQNAATGSELGALGTIAGAAIMMA